MSLLVAYVILHCMYKMKPSYFNCVVQKDGHITSISLPGLDITEQVFVIGDWVEYCFNQMVCLILKKGWTNSSVFFNHHQVSMFERNWCWGLNSNVMVLCERHKVGLNVSMQASTKHPPSCEGCSWYFPHFCRMCANIVTDWKSVAWLSLVKLSQAKRAVVKCQCWQMLLLYLAHNEFSLNTPLPALSLSFYSFLSPPVLQIQLTAWPSAMNGG